MSNTTEGRLLSQDELIELQQQLEVAEPDAWPRDTLTRLATHFLAARFPEHAPSFTEGACQRICEGFGLDLLLHHQLPSSLWTTEELQRKTYGGIEATLFTDLPEGVIDFYAKKLNTRHQVCNDDPLTWDAQEF